MEIRDINLHKVGHSDNYAVVGLYYRNGIFDETDTNRGISYILDHVIFCMLCTAIVDSDDGDVRCFTNYGYSEVVITCEPGKVFINIGRVKDVIFRSNLIYSAEAIQQWIQFKTSNLRSQRMPADVLYYSHRVPSSPLAKTISAGLNVVPSKEELELWRSIYMREECIAAYISGNVPEPLTGESMQFPTHSLLPQVVGKQLMLPKHVPWRRTQILYSVPCDVCCSDILATEAFCQWMNPILSAEIRRNGGQFLSTMIHPDYFQEWQVRFQCPKGTEKRFVEQIIPQTILEAQTIPEGKINNARINVKAYYQRLANDPVAWNRFAGYSAVTGKGFLLDCILCENAFEAHITAETIRKVLLEIQHQKRVCVFASAVR